MPVTEKEIAAWKEKHGQVFEISFQDGKRCFLRQPTRAEVGYAMSKARTNPLGIAEVIVESCWLGGDEEIKSEVGYTVGLTEQIDALIGAKTAQIKNC